MIRAASIVAGYALILFLAAQVAVAAVVFWPATALLAWWLWSARKGS